MIKLHNLKPRLRQHSEHSQRNSHRDLRRNSRSTDVKCSLEESIVTTLQKPYRRILLCLLLLIKGKSDYTKFNTAIQTNKLNFVFRRTKLPKLLK